MSALLAFPYTSLNLYEQGCPWLFAARVRAAIPGYRAPISAVGCYSGRLDEDLGRLGGLMTCQKWCLIYDPRAAAEYDHERLGHHGSCCLALPVVEHLEGGISSIPFRIGRTSKAFAELQRMPFEVAKSVRQLKKTSLSLQGCSGRCPWWGWLLVFFVVGTEMASFLQKLQMFLSYVHAASKTSGLTTSKHENQSTSLSELF